MGPALGTLDDPPPLDPQLVLRYVTAAVAVTAGLWHLAGAASLPAEASATIAGGVALGAGQLAWAAWLCARPSRRCLAIGATAGVVLLAAAGALIVRTGTGGATPGVVTGLTVQVVLLLLASVGLQRRPAAATLRAAARGGAVVSAVTLSVVAAGGFHAHPAGAADQRSTNPSFLCHLV
ncbi:hypothetical protein DSM112329_04836 [Paraconexibacter sp. AEG42_29]|uniref:Uncharacterized protein n=1 Tax=Paraconexibacter sp. AEG42_29 TaxID=2997339 RepID=A0AAU7B2V9_9ACTN